MSVATWMKDANTCSATKSDENVIITSGKQIRSSTEEILAVLQCALFLILDCCQFGNCSLLQNLLGSSYCITYPLSIESLLQQQWLKCQISRHQLKTAPLRFTASNLARAAIPSTVLVRPWFMVCRSLCRVNILHVHFHFNPSTTTNN